MLVFFFLNTADYLYNGQVRTGLNKLAKLTRHVYVTERYIFIRRESVIPGTCPPSPRSLPRSLTPRNSRNGHRYVGEVRGTRGMVEATRAPATRPRGTALLFSLIGLGSLSSTHSLHFSRPLPPTISTLLSTSPPLPHSLSLLPLFLSTSAPSPPLTYSTLRQLGHPTPLPYDLSTSPSSRRCHALLLGFARHCSTPRH